MQHPSEFGSNIRARVPPVDRNSAVDVNRLSTWYEDLEEYEGNLEEMASANLDQSFQDELQHVDQWFGFLSDAEKTATLYTLLQHSSQVQIRFFIHLLQEMRKPKPILRGSDRASALMNLNRRAPVPSQPVNNRHSFALGDTEELSRMFGHMGSDWTNKDQRTNIPPHATSSLRPKSVMELGGGGGESSFSNSWLNQRQPKLFNNDNVIERPRSADISSWHVPSTASWKPLGSDLNWKEPMQRFNSSIVPENSSLKPDEIIRNRRASAAPTHNNNNNNNNNRFSQQQYLSPPQTNSRRSSSTEVVHDTLLGYGSDQSDNSTQSRYRGGAMSSGTHPITIIENNREDDVDMELLQDVTAWLRSLRLHKYNSIFENMRWQDMVKLDDQGLQAKGVAALGARRKMLKVFENVREHCKKNHIEY